MAHNAVAVAQTRDARWCGVFSCPMTHMCHPPLPPFSNVSPRLSVPSLRAVYGGSDIYIEGQFGDVSYPESAAPRVLIGGTPCDVDLDDSTPRLTHCVTQPLVAPDLQGRSGTFTLPLTLYTPSARETDTGEKVAVFAAASCSVAAADGGCNIQFNLQTSPRVESIRTSSLGAGGVLRMGGGGLHSGVTDPEGYGDGSGTGGGEGGGGDSDGSGAITGIPAGTEGAGSGGGTFRRGRRTTEQQGGAVSDESSLEIVFKSTSNIGPKSQCGMRDNNQDKSKTSQDDGSAIGPTSDGEASCKVSAGAGEKASAGPYSVEVKQSSGNRGKAHLNDADAKVDLVSGKRYHFELEARISSIAPILAPIHGGIPITIRGSGFGLDPSVIDARLGGTPCAVDKLVEGGFTCNLPDGQDQYGSTDDWEWESERGARWQWYYKETLDGSIALDSAVAHSAFPDGADGEMLLPMLQPVRRWSNEFVSRITGWFVAPSTADYAFFLRADDTARFYLSEGPEAVRPASPLISLSEPVLQWPAEPQSRRVPLLAGQRYWLEVVCSRSSEYTGYGTPEQDLNAATSGQDGYRMGRCDIGARVHSRASGLPSGAVRGAAFEVHQIVLMSSIDGLVEIGFEECQQWVAINTTSIGSKPPEVSDVEAAVKQLIPTSPLVDVVREKLSEDAYLYNVTIKAAGTHGDMRARSYGIEWSGVRAKIGGIDVLPITGDSPTHAHDPDGASGVCMCACVRVAKGASVSPRVRARPPPLPHSTAATLIIVSPAYAPLRLPMQAIC